MVAVTPRVLRRSVYRTKMARNSGAAFGYELGVDTKNKENMEKLGSGLTAYGGTMNLEGSGIRDLEGSGLYVYGSGMMTYGSGLAPLGMGIFSTIGSVAKKAFNGLKGVVPKQLRTLAVDYGKKQAKKVLPQVIDKVKGEIRKQAPDFIGRLTGPIIKKLPKDMRGPATALVESGTNAIANRLVRLKGSGMEGDPVAPGEQSGPTAVEPRKFTASQFAAMMQQGKKDKAQRSAGMSSSRLMIDSSTQSLSNEIAAQRKYNAIKGIESGQMVVYSPKKAAKRVAKKTTKGKGVVKK